MMSFKFDNIWPLRIDLSAVECRQMLREKELLCYSDVVSILRAQGPPNEEKKSILINLQKLFSISEDRHKFELRRAANNEKLSTICESISGFDSYEEWATLGALRVPPTQRPIPRTIYSDESCQTVLVNLEKDLKLPSPIKSNNLELTKKHEEAISCNRLLKSSQSNTSTVSVSTYTDPVKHIPKCNTSKESSTSLDYNLHLLSEIATGESNQSANAFDSSDSDIKPDYFSIHHQIEDIELSLQVPENQYISQSRYLSSNNPIITQSTSNVLTSNIKNSCNVVKNALSISNEFNPINSSIANSVPIVIGNSNINQASGQRIVIPLNTIPTHNVSQMVTNQQKHQVSNIMPQKQIPTNAFYTLTNNSIRSPPSNQMGYSWASQSSQAQQVIIQNASSHHGLSGVPSNTTHQNIDNMAHFSYILQKRGPKNDQHQNNNKQTLVVRDLGSQPSMDPERNKRFMVVKGGNTLGPSTKKPKISNPSNRQPGRPPLMPAPGSVYKPYLANDLNFTNRTSGNVASSIIDSPVTDSNGLKISSISSGSKVVPVSSSQIIPNSYYTVNRGNGVQRVSSSGSGSGSVVQLSSGTNLRAMEHVQTTVGTSHTLKPKNIQPVISVVPLSPREPTIGDNASFSIVGTTIKEENIDHNSVMPVKVIMKEEDRVNTSSILSLMHSENKIQ